MRFGSLSFRVLVAEFISPPPTVYTFSFIVGNIIPRKSLSTQLEVGAQGFSIQGFEVQLSLGNSELSDALGSSTKIRSGL